MIRMGGALLILALAFGPADAFTVILKNGKTMEGTLLSEESTSIRFRDIYGIEYSLKKDVLNISAMMDANGQIQSNAATEKPVQRKPAATIVHSSRPDLGAIARENRKNHKIAPVFRNAPSPELPTWPSTSPELESWITRTQTNLGKQASRCRAAGGGAGAKHAYRSDTYMVEGKAVVVSGYWADPDEIEAARKICNEAIVTEKALTRAREDLSRLQQQMAEGGDGKTR